MSKICFTCIFRNSICGDDYIVNGKCRFYYRDCEANPIEENSIKSH